MTGILILRRLVPASIELPFGDSVRSQPNAVVGKMVPKLSKRSLTSSGGLTAPELGPAPKLHTGPGIREHRRRHLQYPEELFALPAHWLCVRGF